MNELWQPLAELDNYNFVLVVSGALNVLLLAWAATQRVHIWLLRRRIHRLRNGGSPTIGERLRRAWQAVSEKVEIVW
jgi:hypothetical protein